MVKNNIVDNIIENRFRVLRGGLIPKRRDFRTFSRSKHFGAPFIDFAQIPDFDLAPDAEILEQTESSCTAFSNASVSSLQEGVPISPEYLFYKTKVIQGGNPHTYGANQDDASKALIKFGGIEVKDNPFTFQEKGQYYVEEPKNWEKIKDELDIKAAEHKKQSYMEVDGYGNRFDSILATLWMSYKIWQETKNISRRKGVIVGAYWQKEWITDNGVVPQYIGNDKTLPHQFLFRGKLTINNEPYLIAQNSWGKKIGNNGLFYFPKSVVNSKNFLFARSYEDVDPELVKKLQWTLLQVIYDYTILVVKTIKTILAKEFSPSPQKEENKEENENKIENKVENKIENKVENKIEEEEKEDENKQIPVIKKSLLDDFAQFIIIYENMKENYPELNNPGALKFTEYTQSLGAEYGRNGFCRFPNYEAGLNALKQLIKDAANNRLKRYKNCDILSFFQVFSPAPYNRPDIYAEYVASRLGVPITTKLIDII